MKLYLRDLLYILMKMSKNQLHRKPKSSLIIRASCNWHVEILMPWVTLDHTRENAREASMARNSNEHTSMGSLEVEMEPSEEAEQG